MTITLEEDRPSLQLRFQLGLATFGILALELAVIRFMSQQIRIFAYLNNILLMASFLGMGLGVAIGRRRPRLVHLTLPLLAILVCILRFSRSLHLLSLSFPDISIALWGGEGLLRGETFLSTLVKILLLFILVTSVFVMAGSVVGDLFGRLPPLRAYSADLLGSLLGVLAVTLLSALHTSPPWWFAPGVLAFAFLSRRQSTWISGALVILFATLAIEGAAFSPYNRLDVSRNEIAPGRPLVVAANRDFHQFMHDLSPKAAAQAAREGPKAAASFQWLSYNYDLPFAIEPRKNRALIVGAGTGNDVAAALRAGFHEVVSVDIDPTIIDIGRNLHPERPYDDPRVKPVVNDARAWFEQNRNERFDVVCFGLLDSHAMFSAMSSLRLDNYVYTEEGLRSAWDHVAPGGLMSVSFSVAAGNWISDRIEKTLFEATGRRPVVLNFTGLQSHTFIVSRGLEPMLAKLPLQVESDVDLETVRGTEDDWPFLYLRPSVFPSGYLTVLASILLLAALGARWAFGAELFTRQKFDAPLFLMGAAFLLIETRGVTDLSLLFGSTWIVNSAVFAGVLAVVWVANAAVGRFKVSNPLPMFAPLFLLLLVSWFLRPSLLLQFPIPLAGALGGLANALPIGAAGIIFSILLVRSPDPVASLGSNLLGAMVGGCLEYLSIVTGLRAMSLLALVLYLGVLLLLLRRAPGSLAPASNNATADGSP